MQITLNLRRKQLAFFLASFVILISIGLVIGYESGAPASIFGHSVEELGLGPLTINTITNRVGIGTANPAKKLDVSGEIHATGDICTDEGGGICLGSVGIGGPNLPSITFEVYNSDLATWACVEKDLQDYCGDADGCKVRLRMQHELDGWDQVRTIDGDIYMEQPGLSNNNGVGLYGWTRQNGGDYSWIAGMENQYTILAPWAWAFMLNYKHANCPGQVGYGSAYNDPYQFSFMSHPHIRTIVTIYDNTD